MAVLARDPLAQMARYHAWASERLLASIAPIAMLGFTYEPLDLSYLVFSERA